MKKCEKCHQKLNELDDKTEDLEKTVDSLKALVADIMVFQRRATQEPIIPDHH